MTLIFGWLARKSFVPSVEALLTMTTLDSATPASRRLSRQCPVKASWLKTGITMQQSILRRQFRLVWRFNSTLKTLLGVRRDKSVKGFKAGRLRFARGCRQHRATTRDCQERA